MKNKLLGIFAIAILSIATIACGGDDPAPTPETFTVTFNANGGSPTPPVQTVEKGKTATEPTGAQAPTKANNTLDGWYKEEALTTKWIFANGNGVAADTVTDNITLWAKWELLEPENKGPFTVNFLFQNPGAADAPYQATVIDERTNCGSQNLEQLKVDGKDIVTIIEEAIQGAFGLATTNIQRNGYRRIFGEGGGVTIYVENTETLYKAKATDKKTIYFHIDYLTSSPTDIQQKAFDIIVAMDTNVLPYIAEWEE